MKKLLIVDDDTDQLYGMQTYINELYADTIDVKTATSGEECLEILENADGIPDLIILDVMMPGMDGYELYSALRLDRSLNRVPIIFLTAVDGKMDKVLGKELGDVFIQKPVHMEELMDKIQEQLRKDK